MSSVPRSRAAHPSNSALDIGDLVDVQPVPGDADSVRRLLLIPVQSVDRRAIVALDYAGRIPADDRQAVHVLMDERALQDLGEAWMARKLPYSLSVVDDVGGVAPTIGAMVEHALHSGFDEVIVLVGRLGVRQRTHRILHDRTAEAIERVVGTIPGALTAMMTVATV